ncbi:MAG: hypothetical protein U0894_20725 [Pirellulales bacterium]
MNKYAFAFYMTHWNESLILPFEVCMKSLQVNGGKCASCPRYLIYSGEVTASVKSFCSRHSIQLRLEPRWTEHFRLPNRTLVCKAPFHEVVCLLDTDIVFLQSPEPMFRRAAELNKVHSRLDISLPYSALTARFHLTRLARWIWRRQFSRFALGRALPAWHSQPSGQGLIPPYLNGGVHFVPGIYLERLGTAWQRICAKLYRDARWRRPYTFLFQPYYFEMMSYAMGLHAAEVPWELMPPTHNFMPVPAAPAADKSINQEEVVMLHLVNEMRHWLQPGCPAPGEFQILWDRLNKVLAA